MRFLIIILIVAGCGMTQESTVNSKSCPHYYDTVYKMNIYTFVDQMPVFSITNRSFHNWIMHNFKNTSFEDGKIITTFNYSIIIDGNGNVIDASIRNKKYKDLAEIEKDLLELLERSPKWIPGKCFDKTVPVKLNLKITY